MELCLYFPMCIHGKYKGNVTFLCQNGEGGGAPYSSHTNQTFSTHFVNILCSLLIKAHAPRRHKLQCFGTKEDRRSKNCESEIGKASFCTK